MSVHQIYYIQQKLFFLNSKATAEIYFNLEYIFTSRTNNESRMIYDHIILFKKLKLF